jgi:predicted DNA-binding transcriptional regulator AlpA
MSIASCGLSRLETSGRALFSPREAEQILGVSHATLYRLITAGRLDARKLQSKTVITAASLQQLIDTLPNLRSTRDGRAG